MCKGPDKGSTGESSSKGLSPCDKRAKAAAILTMHRRDDFRARDDASALRHNRRTGVAVKACRSDCTSECTGCVRLPVAKRSGELVPAFNRLMVL